MKFVLIFLASVLLVGGVEIGSLLACSLPPGELPSRYVVDDDTPECFDVSAGESFLTVTNSCDYPVTIEELDCARCEPEVIEPDSTIDYGVPSTSSRSEPNTIGWSSDQGSGTISYTGTPGEEPPEVSCGNDDAACSATAARPGESPLVAVVVALGMLFGLRRRTGS